MRTYILRRLLLAALTLFGVTILVFIVMRIVPGDLSPPILAGGGVPNPDHIARFREHLGLDEPLYVQYFDWVRGLLTFDFGNSVFHNDPMSQYLQRKLPLSAQIGVLGIVIGSTFGVAAGLIAALKRGAWVDSVMRTVALAGVSVPTFWAGMLVILVLVREFGWDPTGEYTRLTEDPVRNLTQLIWPALVIGTGLLMGVPLRFVRTATLEVLREDYIRTARARGLRDRAVLLRHALPNILIPAVSLIAVMLPLTVTALVVTEQAFGLPGIGRMLVGAINQRDYPVVELTVTLIAFAVVVSNVGADILGAALDLQVRSASPDPGAPFPTSTHPDNATLAVPARITD